MSWPIRLLPLMLLVVSCSLSAAQPLRLSTLPLESRVAVVQQFQPLVDYLAEQLGRPVELVWPGYHKDVIESFTEGSVDIAFLGPLPYVQLHKKHPKAIPLVRFLGEDGRGSYRCALVTFGDAQPGLQDLSGKRIGLTQPLSTCGYLGTDALLREYTQITLEDTDYYYLGSHEAVALSVVAGEVDAGGVKDEFAHRFAGLGLQVAGWSPLVPGLALIANGATLDAASIKTLRSLLLATPEEVYTGWGASLGHGMEDAEDADFDPLREMLQSIPLPSM